MVKPNCYAYLFVFAVLVDFFYYVVLAFVSGEFNSCPMPVLFIDAGKVEFFLFWATVILCSLPIKSDAFQIITFFVSLAFFAY
jgi:hypothetical protein